MKAPSIHYILKDHLGSWTTITDAEGTVEQELSFDAWGNLRDPETWSGSYSGTPMFDRGFTGHEHMTAFGLINMNGRCYDPLTSSFLSVDANVQDPTSAQAFNRYAYCGYNPLRYTDPTGWVPNRNGYEPIHFNETPHTQWYSNDPNDVLWGRSVHPCGNSSSGYINGTAVTSTGYTEGNYASNGYGGVGGWVKDSDGIHYDTKATVDTEGFLGITHIEGNDYYGLLGDKYDLNTQQGRFWKDVYAAIIRYIEDSQRNGESFSTVDFSDITEWIPIEKWYKPNINTHLYYNSNPDLKDVLGIFTPCDIHMPNNRNAMRVSFGSWSTAYPFYGKPYFTDEPISLPKSLGQLPKGYPLSFSHDGNARAYVLFLNRESREYTKKQYCRIFDYFYQPNRP